MDKSNICAGIVTFNPQIDLLEKVIEGVIPQVDKVFVFDNNSDNISEIKKLCIITSCELLIADENKGIAFALNRLCERAIELDYSWILTLDHDTIISDGMIESFISILDKEKVGIICPRVHYVGVIINEKYDIHNRYTYVPACMTSGSLMSLEAWKETSHFNEWLFIDSVDNDICYQLKQNGYRIIRDNQTFMEHNLGYPVKKHFFIISYYDYQYSPFRLYYIIRNRIYLTKKYWKLEGVRFILATFKIILSNVAINLSDIKRRRAMFKGLVDGLCYPVR